MKNVLLLLTVLVFTACSENDPRTIADEYCNCRQVETQEGALQGNKCYEEWDKKFGKVKLNEAQQNTFLEITKACN